MVIFDGRIEMVIEMRKWTARAYGISVGQAFFGVVLYTTAAYPFSDAMLDEMDEIADSLDDR